MIDTAFGLHPISQRTPIRTASFHAEGYHMQLRVGLAGQGLSQPLHEDPKRDGRSNPRTCPLR
jgi:hypothetical protein